MSKITIDSKVLSDSLKAMLQAASADMTRPHIACIRLETRGTELRMVATDGHWMLCVDRQLAEEDVYGADTVAHIGTEDAERIVKTLPKRGHVEVDFAAKMVKAAQSGQILSAFAEALTDDRKYPPYEQVIPANFPNADNKRVPTCLSSVLLAEVSKAFQTLSGRTNAIGIRIEYGFAELDPCLVTADIADVTALAVVCPFRSRANADLTGLVNRFRGSTGAEVEPVKEAAE